MTMHEDYEPICYYCQTPQDEGYFADRQGYITCQACDRPFIHRGYPISKNLFKEKKNDRKNKKDREIEIDFCKKTGDKHHEWSERKKLNMIFCKDCGEIRPRK